MLLIRLSDSCIEEGQVDRICSDKVITVLVVAYLNLDWLTTTTGTCEERMSKDLIDGTCA